MRWTEDDLLVLNKAIRSGVLEVDYPGGQRVRYQKLDDMIKLRGEMIRDINRANSTGSYALGHLDGDI